MMISTSTPNSPGRPRISTTRPAGALAIRTGDAAAASCGSGAALDAREHVVTVHGVAQGVAADKQIALHPWDRFIRHDEAIAVAMRHQPTGEQVGIMQFLSRFSVPRNGCCGRRCSWFGKPSSVPFAAGFRRGSLLACQAKAAAVDLLDLTLALQARDDLLQRATTVVAQLKRMGDFPQAGWLASASQMRNHLLVGQFVKSAHWQASLYRLRCFQAAGTFPAAPG